MPRPPRPAAKRRSLTGYPNQARAPLSPEAVRKIYQTVLAEMSAMEGREMQSHEK